MACSHRQLDKTRQFCLVRLGGVNKLLGLLSAHHCTSSSCRPNICHRLHAVVTCEIKLFQNYLSLCRRPSERVIFQRVETCLKLIQFFFTQAYYNSRIFSNMFDVPEIILKELFRFRT